MPKKGTGQGLSGMRSFKDGYRPPTQVEKEYDEADIRLKELSPLYRLTEPYNRIVTNSRFISKIPAALERFVGLDKDLYNFEGRPRNPSFAIPMGRLGGYININPDFKLESHDYPRLLAHESGHIRQGLLGLPLENDDASNDIVNDAINTLYMRKKAQMPTYTPWPDDYYHNLANVGKDFIDKPRVRK